MGSAASSGGRGLLARLRLIRNQTPIAPAITTSNTTATAIPAIAGVPSECDGVDVALVVVIGGSADEPVLVGEVVGEDVVVWL